MSSSSISSPPTDSDASAPSSSSPSPSKRMVYQVETTGSRWGDVKEAFKRISSDDMNRINEIPCARNSLLSGIASGVGIGVIRGMSSSVFVASNWAMGTFVLISLGSWTICQRNRMEERRRMQQVVEAIPKRFVKKDEGSGAGEPKAA
ncbi:hypothetical protein L226DRAFT_532338 [Lentinus tigrinus ALCF2SS1-7]|uniref:Cytochrome c oxidase assembly protein COX20, mitochondrial n=1 Tax=Lentinus tigrinus ALCF2SS1-6 TaxID=1328759 RepID=A0A5C2SG20_9APHY|nr:hypothetical protein L227DRAFT_651597 [Lentinus tigrinus ALCF2SS1-6]RPD77558.1 hypothetical protein L226DRAFT_532338 [Lentinus tigrinus ALCF2SS1-7]